MELLLVLPTSYFQIRVALDAPMCHEEWTEFPSVAVACCCVPLLCVTVIWQNCSRTPDIQKHEAEHWAPYNPSTPFL